MSENTQNNSKSSNAFTKPISLQDVQKQIEREKEKLRLKELNEQKSAAIKDFKEQEAIKKFLAEQEARRIENAEVGKLYNMPSYGGGRPKSKEEKLNEASAKNAKKKNAKEASTAKKSERKKEKRAEQSEKKTAQNNRKRVKQSNRGHTK
jgi:hypothetical protein